MMIRARLMGRAKVAFRLARQTYETSVGFYDLVVAAPSMKAALETWGAGSNLFHQGIAKETDDPDVVAATMAAPCVVLRRPVGSTGAFKENADLPAKIERGGGAKKAAAGP
jgi:colicin import membrane protein